MSEESGSLSHKTTNDSQHLYLQNPMCNFVINFPMYYIGVRNGKKEKEGRINLNFVFCPTIYLATLNVYTKFEDSGSQRSLEICNRKFAWRERKMDK